MAKKSKRQAARRQHQRPVARPGQPPQATTPAESEEAELNAAAVESDEEYAATAIPIAESDGPMPLPPPDTEADEDADARPAAAVPAPRPAATAASVSTPGRGARRRVGRLDPAAAAVAQRPGQRGRPGRQSTAAMFEPLPPEDAAIPFDRVPYVPGDLRRVLIIAGLMVVLIVVADFVVNAVVK